MTSHAHLDPVDHGPARSDARLVVYGVHGRTQSPEFLKELAARLGLDLISWVLPAAADNSWYPGKFMADMDSNQPQLGQAIGVVEKQLEGLLRERDAGGPPVAVLGFSQGACLLAEYLLTRQPAVDGVVLHTGGFLGPDRRTFAQRPGSPMANTQVELFCADQDPWVPLQRAKETAEAFEAVVASTSLTVYHDSEHHINDHALGRMRMYLRGLVDRASV